MCGLDMILFFSKTPGAFSCYLFIYCFTSLYDDCPN